MLGLIEGGVSKLHFEDRNYEVNRIQSLEEDLYWEKKENSRLKKENQDLKKECEYWRDSCKFLLSFFQNQQESESSQ